MSELPAERSPERLVQLRDTNGSPTWGVEWRACDEPDATLVYAINLLSKPVEIQVNAGPGRKIAEMHDLLTGKVVDERFGLDSLQTVILRVKWMARQSS